MSDKERSYTIYSIDFDGTICENKFPEIGDINKEAYRFIQYLQYRGDKWILNTMREGKLLDEAVEFCHRYALYPDAVNDNLDEMKKAFNNNPRKIYADVYIDDHNAGGLRWED